MISMLWHKSIYQYYYYSFRLCTHHFCDVHLQKRKRPNKQYSSMTAQTDLLTFPAMANICHLLMSMQSDIAFIPCINHSVSKCCPFAVYTTTVSRLTLFHSVFALRTTMEIQYFRLQFCTKWKYIYIDKRRVWQLPFHTCIFSVQSERNAMTASCISFLFPLSLCLSFI